MCYNKIMENVGYIEKNNLKLGFGKNDINDIIGDIKFGCRDEVEQRADVIQLICAGVIFTDKEILTLKKSKKQTGNNSSEQGKTLLYVGGHLDEIDNVNNFVNTLKNGMKREIFEELDYSVDERFVGSPLVVYTPINDKSKRHLGVIFPIKINDIFNADFIDGKCKFIEIGEVENINNLEEWSKIILKELIIKNI